jgi:hypothetical protein
MDLLGPNKAKWLKEEGSQKKKKEKQKRGVLLWKKSDTKRGRVGAGPPGRRRKHSLVREAWH